MKQFVYHNADGVRRTMIPITEDQFAVKTELVLDGILDGIKRDKELVDPRSTNKLVARVPMTIYEKSLHEGWDEDDWKKWLNDPDNRCFRVWEGRL